jgi:hypothetical protein
MIHGDEDIKKLGSINDIRNGFLVMVIVRKFWKTRKVVILKVPGLSLFLSTVPPF